MSFLTKYGTLLGDIPGFLGRVHFVAPSASYVIDGKTYSASDNNDGLAPDRAVVTVAQAVTNATASAGEIIVLLPGTHSSAAAVTIAKAGLSFVGMTPTSKLRPLSTKVNWTSTLAGTAVALSAADCTFVGINMIPVTAQTFMTAVTCPRTSFIDCAVTLSAAASTSTKGIVASGGSSAYCSFINCDFHNTVATSAQGPALDVSGMDSVLVESCRITQTGTSSAWALAIQCASGTSGIFKLNTFNAQGVGTMTIGVDGTGVVIAGAVMFENNKVGVSPGAGAFKNFDADSGVIVSNHLATVSSGTGETLVTLTI